MGTRRTFRSVADLQHVGTLMARAQAVKPASDKR
jgi:hypothetical protein